MGDCVRCPACHRVKKWCSIFLLNFSMNGTQWGETKQVSLPHPYNQWAISCVSGWLLLPFPSPSPSYLRLLHPPCHLLLPSSRISSSPLTLLPSGVTELYVAFSFSLFHIHMINTKLLLYWVKFLERPNWHLIPRHQFIKSLFRSPQLILTI